MLSLATTIDVSPVYQNRRNHPNPPPNQPQTRPQTFSEPSLNRPQNHPNIITRDLYIYIYMYIYTYIYVELGKTKMVLALFTKTTET